MKKLGLKLIELGRMRRDERGAIDIGGILIMGIGMVVLAVGFIMFPIVTTATDALLIYNCTASGGNITAATFTGFTPIVGITPLLVLIGYLSAAVFSMYLGVKIMKCGAGGTKLDLGTVLLLGISLIFIAIGLIILPVTLDGISLVRMDVTATATQAVTTTDGSAGTWNTTGNVTLGNALICESTAQVTSITSTNVSDVPVAGNYTPLTQSLQVSGLTANTSHNITVNYNYNAQLASYTGLWQILGITPLLALISFVAGAVVSGFFGMKRLASTM